MEEGISRGFFNIIKGALNGVLIYILYKPLLKAINKTNV